MKIQVSLYGVFRIDRFKEEVREYPDFFRVKDVIRELGFPDQLLGAVVVNDSHTSVEHVLQDGDRLMLLPLLDGG